MKKIVVFLGLILSVLGCTKVGKNVSVSGRVVNPITGEAISGMKLELRRDALASPGTPNTDVKVIEESTTDENGYFEINKLASRKPRLRVVLGETAYLRIGWYVDNAYTGDELDLPVKKGNRVEADYHMVPYGQLKISLHNVNCAGTNDTLIYNRTYISFEGIEVFQPFVLTGCYNTEGAFAQVPSGNYLVEWTVIRSGVSNSYSHVIAVPGNGQAEYNIDY
jgi:hypothetical protein